MLEDDTSRKSEAKARGRNPYRPSGLTTSTSATVAGPSKGVFAASVNGLSNTTPVAGCPPMESATLGSNLEPCTVTGVPVAGPDVGAIEPSVGERHVGSNGTIATAPRTAQVEPSFRITP